MDNTADPATGFIVGPMQSTVTNEGETQCADAIAGSTLQLLPESVCFCLCTDRCSYLVAFGQQCQYDVGTGVRAGGGDLEQRCDIRRV